MVQERREQEVIAVLTRLNIIVWLRCVLGLPQSWRRLAAPSLPHIR